MRRETFGKLLQKYLRNECTPQERELVEHWYSLLDNQSSVKEEDVDWKELESQLWGQIHEQIETPSRPTFLARIRTSYQENAPFWKSVAVLICVLGLGWGLWQRMPSLQQSTNNPSLAGSESDWVIQSNDKAQSVVVKLEDGSTVRLLAHSSLRYPKHFDTAHRTVYLKGEAFFSIEKMPSKPFFVHTNNLTTKVLGTSFFIRAKESLHQIKVEVVTGRVMVYSEQAQAKTQEVVLTPNQLVTFDESKEQLVTGLVENPKLLPAVQQFTPSFRYNDTPLSEVVTELERAYGVKIELGNEHMKECPFTADLSSQNLYTQLDIICAALKSRYTVQGTSIFLTGKGCQ